MDRTFTFFLGTHRACWLATSDVPLFVSRRQLQDRRTFPRAAADWALDSGGFTELQMFHGWSITEREYVVQVRRFHQEIGRMLWAAPMDWMCEEEALKKTGLSIPEHQRRTLVSFLRLREMAPELPIIPVLQGDALEDYYRHAEAYMNHGVDLWSEPLVGVGSICRRQATKEIETLAWGLSCLTLHGFGVKVDGLRRYGAYLNSSDSLAWSKGARHKPPLPGCVGHKNCANCWVYARAWYDRVIESYEEGLRNA